MRFFSSGSALRRAGLRAGLALLVLLPGWGACGPQVSLKRPHRFTAEEVKLTLWNDRCSLQSFFDANPPANEIVSEQGWTERIGPGRVRERGVITIRVTAPAQRRQLQALLVRYYRVPTAMLSAREYEVTLSYVRVCGRPRQMIRAPITVRAGEHRVRLAYHPCIGEFSLNRDLYQFRAQLLRKGDIRVAGRTNPSSRAGVRTP